MHGARLRMSPVGVILLETLASALKTPSMQGLVWLSGGCVQQGLLHPKGGWRAGLSQLLPAAGKSVLLTGKCQRAGGPLNGYYLKHIWLSLTEIHLKNQNWHFSPNLLAMFRNEKNECHWLSTCRDKALSTGALCALQVEGVPYKAHHIFFYRWESDFCIVSLRPMWPSCPDQNWAGSFWRENFLKSDQNSVGQLCCWEEGKK